jgi:hypothetical protein
MNLYKSICASAGSMGLRETWISEPNLDGLRVARYLLLLTIPDADTLSHD